MESRARLPWSPAISRPVGIAKSSVSGGAVQHLSLSPDGRELAFITSTRTRRTLMIVPTVGGSPHELYQTPDNIGGTAWTRGRVMVYSYPEKAFLSFPTTGGPPDKTQSSIHDSQAAFVISPDGTQIALNAGKNKKGIWAVSGLLPDAKPAPLR